MKVTYDWRTDTLTVILREQTQVAESDEDKPGVVLDASRISIETRLPSVYVFHSQEGARP